MLLKMQEGLIKQILLKLKRDWRKEWCRRGSGSDKMNVRWNGSGMDETIVAEMEAGVMKMCCWNGRWSDEQNVSWNGSGIDEINVAEMKAGMMKICCWRPHWRDNSQVRFRLAHSNFVKLGLCGFNVSAISVVRQYATSGAVSKNTN